MKYQLLFVLSLFSFLSCFPYQPDCEAGRQRVNAVVVFMDYTDTLNYRQAQLSWQEDMEQLRSSFFPLEPCTGGSFELVPINELGSNPTQRFSYQPLPAYINKYDIPVDYQHFIERSHKAVKMATNLPARELPLSTIYEPACRHLAQLSRLSSTGRKQAVFYSDMLEHSKVDFYKTDKNRDALLAALEQAYGCRMPNLEGIDIVIVNHREAHTDEAVRRANQFWEWLFKKFGARSVYTGSSLHLNNS